MGKQEKDGQPSTGGAETAKVACKRCTLAGAPARGSFVQPTVEKAKPSTYPLLKESICHHGTLSTDVDTHLHRERILPGPSIKGNVSQSASLGIVKERT